ncbi:AAA family ATPase [Candidatus Binatia bacterium]|nr:AAA family ATPase [Candidatus Binatia bacterium]
MALYDHFYGFRAAPFTLNPDPRFLFLSRRHREALAGLVHSIDERKGFSVLAGEVGTGKTTLVHAILAELGSRVRTAILFNPGLSRAELYAHLLSEFRLPEQATVLGAIRALNTFLLEQFAADTRVVVVLDEAHALPAEVLEEVRLLSNFETSQAKLLQVVLVGQPELIARLEARDLRQLRQRIALRFQLGPLTFAETVAYMRSRVQAAGGKPDLFLPATFVAVYRFSGGTPRLINVICDHALLAGFVRDRRQIGPEHVAGVVSDLGLVAVARVGLWQLLRGPHRRPGESGPLIAVPGHALGGVE